MTMFIEGWPVYGALALVALITYGALRRHLKAPRPPIDPKKEHRDDR